ncbi:hypothetical protein L580_0502 [Serratia fonticola AU-P3(3)]|nr:hypothetical protein L580_0502 [Serratia fonticola AU-P3(3)]
MFFWQCWGNAGQLKFIDFILHCQLLSFFVNTTKNLGK